MTKIILTLLTIILTSTPVLAVESSKDNKEHVVNLCNVTTPEQASNNTEFTIEVLYRFPTLSNEIGKLVEEGECHTYIFYENTILEWRTGNFQNESFLGSQGIRTLLITEPSTTVNFEGQYGYNGSELLLEQVNTYIQ